MKAHRGVATVEFALVLSIVLLLLLGLVELGRVLFTWNSAVDATRRGARTAAIVALNDKPKVLAEMRLVMPELTAPEINVEYSIDGTFPGAACVRGTCRFVRVSLTREFHPAVYFLPAVIPLPDFATTVPVEALGAT